MKEEELWLKYHYNKHIDTKYRKGFNKGIYASITNEIYRQIGELKKEGYKPSLIRLGWRASFCFAKEHWGNPYKESTWVTSYLDMPIIYKDKSISGVVVESTLCP